MAPVVRAMRNSSLLKWAQAGAGGKASSASATAAGGSVNGSAQPNSATGATNASTGNSRDGNRSWIHPPDTLQRGHIAYLVKFLGTTEVAQAKGILIVKEAIRKLRFSQQLRKAEGAKTPKVELTVSIDGVAIQEPKTKRILHQYPLHRISYCADDKGEKRFFSFIAKEAERDAHSCFVFVSDKLAEEITLTIGQAFDLAYRRFVETSGRDLEAQRRLMLLQQRALRAEAEASALRRRLGDVAKMVSQMELDRYLTREGIQDLMTVDLLGLPAMPASPTGTSGLMANSPEQSHSPNSSSMTEVSYDLLGSSTPDSSMNKLELGSLNLSSSLNSSGSCSNSSGNGLQSPPPPVPPRAFETPNSMSSHSESPAVGTRLEGLLLDELDTDDDFDPRAFECSIGNGNSSPAADGQDFDIESSNNKMSAPRLAPPPKMSRDSRRAHPVNGTSPQTSTENPFKEDLFGSTPFNPSASPQANLITKVSSPPTQIANVADPFGMGDFSGGKESQYLENAIGLLDKRILEMKDGFSRGLSFGNEDFSLESLDPLRN